MIIRAPDDWMTAVRVPKLHQVIVADVLAAIVRGDHAEGARLPKEEALAHSFEVSRYVARQAVQALRDRGLVSVTHGVGAVVEPRHRWNLFDPVLLEAMLAGPDADAAIEDARECVVLVWPEIAGLAAMRRTAGDLERVESAEDAQQLRDALVIAARNRFLGQVVSTLDGAAVPRPADREAYRDVVGAVRAGDAEAARAAMIAVVQGPSDG